MKKVLLELVKSIHEESRGEYGSPKIHQELRRHGTHCGRKRVAGFMRKDGLKAKTRHDSQGLTKAADTPHGR